MKFSEALTKTIEILCGEEFDELRMRDKQGIFDTILDTDADIDTDADSDGCSLEAESDGVTIVFFSHAEEAYEDEIRKKLDTMAIYIDGEEVTIDQAIEHTKAHKRVPLAILNTSILTVPGTYTLEDISLKQARELVRFNEIDSAVGHQSTAEVMTTLLKTDIPVNRQVFHQEPGQDALVFKLNGRPQEDKILTAEEIEEMGYKFQLLKRLR